MFTITPHPFMTTHALLPHWRQHVTGINPPFSDLGCLGHISSYQNPGPAAPHIKPSHYRCSSHSIEQQWRQRRRQRRGPPLLQLINVDQFTPTTLPLPVTDIITVGFGAENCNTLSYSGSQSCLVRVCLPFYPGYTYKYNSCIDSKGLDAFIMGKLSLMNLYFILFYNQKLFALIL